MKKYLDKIQPKHYPLLTVMITLLTFGITLSYLGLLNNGMYIVARSDLLAQYIPFIKMFTRVLTGQESYWFTWSVNMGSNTSALYAYYTLSPFNLLYLIFGKLDENTVTSLVMLGKAGLAAYVFQMFERKVLKQNGIETIAFTLCYVMCGFHIVFFFDIIWMDVLYVLPLLMYVLAEFMEKNKWIPLIFVYAFSFIINFYMSYMLGIFSAVVFALCMILRYEKGRGKQIAGKMFAFGGCVLLAAGMAAVVLLPAGISLLTNVTENYPAFESPTLFDIAANLYMGQMQGLDAIHPYVYCGLPVLMLVPFYFANPKISKKEKCLAAGALIFLTVPMMFNVLNRWMHAGDQPNMMNYRYSYIFSFVLVVLACRESRYIKEIRAMWWKLYVGLLAAFYIFIAYFQNMAGVENAVGINGGTILNVVFLAGWFLIGNQLREENTDKQTMAVAVLGLIALEAGLNAYICIGHLDHKPVMERDYQIWRNHLEPLIAEMKEDEGLYRTSSYLDLNYNSASWFQYKGLASFSSSSNNQLTELLQKLGIYSSSLVNADMGYTDFTNMLLGTKYRLVGTDIQWANTKYERPAELLPLEQSLELGYMVPASVQNVLLESDNPFENQNLLMRAMTMVSEDYFIPAEAEMRLDNAELSPSFDKTYIQRKTDIEKTGEIVYEVNAKPDRNVFGFFSNSHYLPNKKAPLMLALKTDKRVNNIYLVEPIMAIPYCMKSEDMTGKEKHEFAIQFTEKGYSAYYYNQAYFYYENHKIQDQAYEYLKENQWKVLEHNKDFIKAEVTATSEKPILFTSIPYDKGWILTVDGEKKEPLKLVNDTFLGLELQEGKHMVELKYEAPGARIGIMISVASLGIFLLLVLCSRLLIYMHSIQAGNAKERQKEAKDVLQ